MIVLLIILVITGLLIWGILEGVALFELGSPISDKDISDYLDKIESKNLINGVSKRWNDKFVLDITGWNNPSIYETQYYSLFPYHIPEVGVIPIWSKSYSRVKKLFKDDIENSTFKTNKRKKLGLD
jgi:hypothetical protein